MKLFTCYPRLRMGTWFLEPYRLNAGWEYTSVLICPTRGCIRFTTISRRFLARPTSITFWFRFLTGLNGPWEGKRNYAGRSSRSGSATLRLALAPGDSTAAEMAHIVAVLCRRSEERRVGKECRSRWWAYHYKKKSKKTIDE